MTPELISALVATVALVVSLYNPVRNLLKGVRVKIHPPQLFSITNGLLGNISLNMFIDIHNSGGKTVHISKLNCYVVKEDKTLSLHTPAQTYLYTVQQQPIYLFIGTITLKPDEHWVKQVFCYRYFNEVERKEAGAITSKIYDNLYQKNAKRAPNEPYAEVDADLVTLAKQHYNKMFPLTEGNYNVLIGVHADDGKLLHTVAMRFTLYEHDIQFLKSTTDYEFRYGHGIWTASAASLNVMGTIIEDKKLVRGNYEKLAAL